jgi:ribosomal protein S18 acetylase RimI-like enzyme
MVSTKTAKKRPQPERGFLNRGSTRSTGAINSPRLSLSPDAHVPIHTYLPQEQPYAMTLVLPERALDSTFGAVQQFQLKPLDWDTSFFGARMGTIVRTIPTLQTEAAASVDSLTYALRSLLDDARSAGYAHLILRLPIDDLSGIWAAEGSGLKLVDVGIDSRITLGHDVASAHSPRLTIRACVPGDVDTLREIAADAFKLSRFSADPFFTDDQVKEFHRTWTTNLCQGLAQTVLVAERDGGIAGFVSCSVSGTEGRIPLIATNALARGQGVGRALVAAALRWFSAAGCRVADVKTQAQNYSALALYHRSGFNVFKTELTFSIALGSAVHSDGGPR